MTNRPFDGFTQQALSFLDDLDANSDRDWFTRNKPTFETEIKNPAAIFCAEMEAGLVAETGVPHNGKVFRIYRDVRFSKDKRPYNAHVHIAFSPQSRLKAPPMWFFGLGTQQLSLGCGVFAFDKAELGAFRDRVAGPTGATVASVLDGLKASGARISAPDLKRVPQGYDKDHPRADLLRHKGLAAWLDFPDRGWITGSGAVARTLAEFGRLRPLFDILMGDPK